MKSPNKRSKKKAPETSALPDLRKKVDQLDGHILNLLNQRAQVALDIGKIKESYNLKFHVPEREREIYRSLEKANEEMKGFFPTNAVHKVFREIISASLALEKPLSVAYLGPKATFTHLATIEHFGLSTDARPIRSIPEIFAEVERKRVEYGVVPIENSTEGMVNHTLDLFVDSKLKIVSEITLEVDHNLLTQNKVSLNQIQKVASHGHALAQCRLWLEKNLPGIAIQETESTGQAAQMAVDEQGVAAIASHFAANLYDLDICRERIQDHMNNYTRFLVLGRTQPKASGNDKTSLLFAVKDRPGILFHMLKPFAEQKVNLTKIESRPLKTKPWNYVFFIDLDGHIDEPRVIKATKELEKNCNFFKILGSYPKAHQLDLDKKTAKKKTRKRIRNGKGKKK